MKALTPQAHSTKKSEYNVEITEFDGRGKFRAVCRETGLEIIDRDPEHTICHGLHLAGCEDGPVYFWRNSQKSMTIRSLVWGAQHRIQDSDRNGLRLVKRREAPSIHSDTEERPVNAQNTAGGGQRRRAFCSSEWFSTLQINAVLRAEGTPFWGYLKLGRRVSA